MTDYKMPLPRTAFGAAAVALSAVTLALSVYLPASMTPENEGMLLAAPHVEGGGFREVNIEPSRILVLGTCPQPQKMALEHAKNAEPKHDQSS
jgi:hypothetical protein